MIFLNLIKSQKKGVGINISTSPISNNQQETFLISSIDKDPLQTDKDYLIQLMKYSN